MLKKTLGVEAATALLARDDKDEAMDEACGLCRDRLTGALRDVSKLLAAAEGQGGFLGGQTPEPSDINLGGAVYTVKALLDSGLAADGKMTPELERYLERWCRRDSWLKVYGTGQLFNAVIVRSFANKLCTVAPDVCSPDSVREACDEARRLDPRYQALLQTNTTTYAEATDDGAICI